MDEHYPHAKAGMNAPHSNTSTWTNGPIADAIEHWNRKLSATDAPLVAMGMAWPAAAFNPELITITKLKGDNAAKATFPGLDKQRNEAVFTVVGALHAKDLPPVRNISKIPGNKLKYIQQHASVVGFRGERFEAAMHNMHQVAYAMASAFDDGAVSPWTPVDRSNACAAYGTAMSSSCKYFTTGRDVPDNVKTSFHPKTDPQGTLTERLSDTVAHCFDNDVMYMELRDNQYIERDPATFKTGDIVEMGFAFVAWKLRGTKGSDPKYTCKLVLRTLTLLDGTFHKEAYFARTAYMKNQAHMNKGTDDGCAVNQLAQRAKRSVADAYSDMAETTIKRLHYMTLGDDTIGGKRAEEETPPMYRK